MGTKSGRRASIASISSIKFSVFAITLAMVFAMLFSVLAQQSALADVRADSDNTRGGGTDASTSTAASATIGESVNVQYYLKLSVGTSSNNQESVGYYVLRLPKDLENVQFTFHSVPVVQKYPISPSFLKAIEVFQNNYQQGALPSLAVLPADILAQVCDPRDDDWNPIDITAENCLAQARSDMDADENTPDQEVLAYAWVGYFGQLAGDDSIEFRDQAVTVAADTEHVYLTSMPADEDGWTAAIGAAEVHAASPIIESANAAQYDAAKSDYAQIYSTLAAYQTYNGYLFSAADTVFYEDTTGDTATGEQLVAPRVTLANGDWDGDGAADNAEYQEYGLNLSGYHNIPMQWIDITVQGSYEAKPIPTEYLPAQVFTTWRCFYQSDGYAWYAPGEEKDSGLSDAGCLSLREYGNHAALYPAVPSENPESYIDADSGNGVLGNNTCLPSLPLSASSGKDYLMDIDPAANKTNPYVAPEDSFEPDGYFNYVKQFNLNENSDRTYVGFGVWSRELIQYQKHDGTWVADVWDARGSYPDGEVPDPLPQRQASPEIFEDQCDQVAAKVTAVGSVTYEFVSGTAGHETLPQAVMALLPSAAMRQAALSTVTTPAAPTQTVADPDGGTWEFKQWSDAAVQVRAANTQVTGTWEWRQGAAPAKHDPPVQKIVSGDTPSSAQTFEFSLTRDDASYPMPNGASRDSVRVSVAGAGSAEFGEISFASAGEYTYTVREVVPNPVPEGYTYDSSYYKIKYTVSDNGSGALTAVRTVTKVAADGSESAVDLGADGAGIGIVFTNEYQQPATAIVPELPLTGGLGAEGFYFFGAAMMLVSGSLLAVAAAGAKRNQPPLSSRTRQPIYS